MYISTSGATAAPSQRPRCDPAADASNGNMLTITAQNQVGEARSKWVDAICYCLVASSSAEVKHMDSIWLSAWLKSYQINNATYFPFVYFRNNNILLKCLDK